jgi:hypothetical protein
VRCLRGVLVHEGGAGRSVQGDTASLPILPQPYREEAAQHVDITVPERAHQTPDLILGGALSAVHGSGPHQVVVRIGLEGHPAALLVLSCPHLLPGLAALLSGAPPPWITEECIT